MGYIQQLRTVVGSRPIIMVGTGVLLLKENQILLQRRSDNGLWGIPGGSMEPGESITPLAQQIIPRLHALKQGSLSK